MDFTTKFRVRTEQNTESGLYDFPGPFMCVFHRVGFQPFCETSGLNRFKPAKSGKNRKPLRLQGMSNEPKSIWCISMHMANEKLILTLSPNADTNHNPKPNIYVSVST